MAYGRGNLLWTTLPPIDMASKADKVEKRKERERLRERGKGTTTALIMRQVFASPRLVFSFCLTELIRSLLEA